VCRKGLDPQLLQLLTTPRNSSSSSSHPLPQLQRLIYLSCGFQALMGDTDALLTAGWRLSSCQAFFFFPGTDSIETLAVFDI
jgi:tRNA/tmRNA/rRNA uracil-C5-methylase (TrmA/RlmC/RlmD family)